jgi:exosome complex component CSL4
MNFISLVSKMQKRIVVPGEFLGTEEEFFPGSGVYVEDEKIYSSLSGVVEISNKQISVLQKKPLEIFDVGSTIIGVIENIIEPIALVNIHSGVSDEERFGETPDYGVLHASMIKKGFVRNVRDEYKIGDIIRAKIVDFYNGEFRLSTEGENFGAVKAFCALCRHPLRLKEDYLVCENCGARDKRKIAKDYRQVDVKNIRFK